MRNRDQEKVVKEAARYFGFGAAFEVTNGIADSSYGKKAGQARAAKEHLDTLLKKDNVRFATGLAYLINYTDIIYRPRVNVILNVLRYDEGRLAEIFQKAINCNHLNDKRKRLVEVILRRKEDDEKLADFLTTKNEQVRDYAKTMGISAADYRGAMSEIKGVVMELYIGQLFEVELADKVITHRFVFSREASSDADVLVMANEHRFYGALERLARDTNIRVKIISRKL